MFPIPVFIENIDIAILNFFQSFDIPLLTRLARVVTLFGDGGIFWILLSLALAIIPKTRKYGTAMVFALILSLIFTNILIKPAVARIRPYDLYDFIPRAPKPGDLSFPSGHASASFAAAVAFAVSGWREYRSEGIGLVILAAAIGLSRIILLVHYPSDVVAGTVIGTACGIAAAIIVVRICKRVSARKTKEETA